MALGADRTNILNLVLGQGLRLASIGVGVGLIASIVVAQTMKSLLYDVSTVDPLIFAGVSLLLIVVALFACYAPARRATRTDPMICLRSE